jgi:hypothetical protein
MRTKTLLVTAALSVAAATSWAQVYSVNAVGYVNLTLRSNPAGPTLGTIIANPLNGTNNELNTIMPLADAYDGTTIFRFDPVSQSYFDALVFFAGLGWTAASGSTVLDPGEGAWCYPQGPNPLNVTFVGEVPQGSLANPLPAPNKLSMRSSQVPQTARLGTTGTAGTLEFAAEDGDTVYIFDSTTQTYLDAFVYFDGIGWTGPDPDANGPTVNVATGFFVQKSGTAVRTSWTRTFSVN